MDTTKKKERNGTFRRVFSVNQNVINLLVPSERFKSFVKIV